MIPTCIIQLGRMGDLLNILPLAINRRWAVMAHKDYAGILDGCSQVTPEVWDGDLCDVMGAAEWAGRKYERVIVTAFYGNNPDRERRTAHYCLEEWERCGALGEFGTHPLYFDRRDMDREAALRQGVSDGRPMLLLSLMGHSGPFGDAGWMRQEITSQWGRAFNIVDLPTIKAHRFYDLLGLYDRAALLLTVDTSTLHLAAASMVPAIELLSYEPEDWHGSEPKGNCVLACKYREARDRMKAIHECIESFTG